MVSDAPEYELSIVDDLSRLTLGTTSILYIVRCIDGVHAGTIR